MNSINLQNDIDDFILKFNFNEIKFPELMSHIPFIHPYISHRMEMIKEEVKELHDAVAVADKEQMIDALVDIVYVAIGTARMCGFDFNKHWEEVHKCNMKKVRGVSKRGHDFDVCKPLGWQEPNHKSIYQEQ